MNGKKLMKPLLAFVLAFAALMSAVSVDVFALPVNGAGNETETPSLGFHVDGERVSLDDDRIINIVSVKPSRLKSARPNVESVGSLSGEFSQSPNVTMDGKTVSARRYIVIVDGIEYEAYCADPKLPGPESAGAVYELSGEAHAQLKNALKNGYPVNTAWSNASVDTDDRMWNVYITRVAVAMANNPTNNFQGNAVALSQATALANGSTVANQNSYPPIMVNGIKEAKDTGRTINDADAVSETFEITHNRKTNIYHNPFRFEWAAGTPDGTKLVVDGTVIATAPDNPDTVYRDDITSFTIEIPNAAENEGKTAAVNLVGIHNQFKDTIWMLQNPNDPEGWQDIVFYIPEVSASAAFSYVREPDVPEEAELRIVKQNSSGKRLAGAVFEITGPNGYSKQETTPSTGIIKLTGLTPGDYTITEITPPSGHKLAEPASVTVTIAEENPGTIERVFINAPEDKPDPEPVITSVIIQKIDAITRENIPGALMRLRGISSAQVITEDGQIREIDNTGINLSQVLTAGATTGGGDVKSTVTDGVWALEGLPYGAYVVEEERAPANYSLLPQHTSYSFWLLPGNVIIKLNQDESTVYVDDVQVSVHEALNATIAGIQNYDNAAGLAAELQEILDTLLSQLQVDAVFTVEVDKSTNSQLITFENFPFGKIEVTKYDMVTGETLAGTHFRIQGYFAEGNTNGMPIDRILVTGADGKVVFDNLPAGQYTISEAEAPPGYQFDPNEFRSISITWGQTASTTFYNKPKTFVEVIKVDGDDSSKLLDGAIFRLTDPTSGEIWEGTTSGGKVRLGEGGGSFGNQLVEETLYILTEIQAPKGYVLDSSPIEVIVAADNQLNTITVRNFLKPTLTIIKYDELTNEPLAGATFRLWKTEGETWSETMVTDANGTIVWTDLDPGIYSIQEIVEPFGYIKDPTRKEILLEGGDKKTLSFFNRPRPTLEIIKIDEQTKQPLAGAKFRVWATEGDTVGEYVTDANGRILIPNLDDKIYSVEEIVAPDGYVLNPQKKEILLEWGKVNTLIFTNLKKPTLTVIKYDELTNLPLAGASFRLWKTEGETWSETMVTDANGVIIWTDLDPGIYSVQEIDEPYGYFRDPARKEILLEGGDNKELEFFNRPRPVLTILKRDAVTGVPLEGVKFKVQRLEGETIGEFLTDSNGMIELSPRTGYLLDEKIYRVTEITPPINYLLSDNPTKDVLLKWYEPTELIFENLLKPTLIFIKRDGMSGRGISGATYRVQYESPTGGVITLGSYITKCGLIVLPYVTPGWYVLTETIPASGYSLPTNPTQRFYLAPGENSYTYAQTQADLYVDPRTNPNSGKAGVCGECCGFLCSVLCAGNCSNPGDGTMSPGGSTGGFGDLKITNGNGDPLGSGTTKPTDPGTDPGTNPSKPTLTAGSVTRNSDLTATVQFTSSVAGRYYYSVVNSGAAEPYIATGGAGTACTAGVNSITAYMTSGAKDLYIKVKDADGNFSDALKISIPAYSTTMQITEPDTPDFSGIVITGGTVVYLNPDFAGITITFGGK